jgi:hypothetical protein
MPLDPAKAFERTVDGLARIYAVVTGLALTESIKTLIAKRTGDPDLSLADIALGLPAFIAFVFTLVPFWHGNNRHLDRTYLEKNPPIKAGAVVFDFVIFFVQATLLFVAAESLRAGLLTFYSLGGVLLIDVVWGYVAQKIHAGRGIHVRNWAFINLLAAAAAFHVIVYFDNKPWGLAAIAVVRTTFDYWMCWDFYIPRL